MESIDGGSCTSEDDLNAKKKRYKSPNQPTNIQQIKIEILSLVYGLGEKA